MTAPTLTPLRIKLPYGTREEFIERYGSNVARGGIFVATRSLKPEGTAIAFEFVLADGTRLLRGEAVVAKAQVDQGGMRAGMTLRFTRLDPQSKALVDLVVAARTAPPPPPPTPPPPPADPPRQPEPELHLIRPEDIPPPPPAPKRRRSVPQLESPHLSTPGDRSTEPVLGIDLGTTNSRVAVFQDGAARLLPVDAAGRAHALPSLVALDPSTGKLVVGEAARDAMVRDPHAAVFAAKRLLGQRARSPAVTGRAGRLPFAVVPDRSGDAAVRFGDNVYSMAELSSVLLTELKDAASRHLGRPVSRAVLCVPAYFTNHQRTAMLEAGRLAGLEVLRIFNEPTSVALAFGYGKALPRKRLLVYDLGGGTFGASVVEVTGDELEVVATGGDNFLGGMDFDERVSQELASRFEEKERRKLDATPAGHQRLRDTSERAKIALSDQLTADVHLSGAAIGPDGGAVDLRDQLSREKLEWLTSELVDRTIDVTRAVLASAGLTAEKLDEVLLVGGQSKAPLVRRRVQELAGKAPRTDVDAQAAVALGAAILGHALVEASRGKPGVTLSEVLSAPIGIGVKGGAMLRVFERNTRLPAEKTVSVPVHEGQSVSVAVFQGMGALAEENEYLGSISASADRSGEVTLHFALSADGTLDLSALSPAGRREVARMTTADAPDEARAAMFAASPLGDDHAPAGGLLKGFKRLFGR